jgi:hypothetical protein
VRIAGSATAPVVWKNRKSATIRVGHALTGDRRASRPTKQAGMPIPRVDAGDFADLTAEFGERRFAQCPVCALF